MRMSFLSAAQILITASAGGAWKSETAWVDSGGGISPDKIAIPAWQNSLA